MSDTRDEQTAREAPVSEGNVPQLLSGQLNRRLSRRRLLGQAAGLAGAVAVTTTMGNFTSAPAEAALPSNDRQLPPTRPTQLIELEDDAPLLRAALASSGIQQIIRRYGANALKAAKPIHAKYAQTDVEAVTMILRRDGAPNRGIFAFFRAGKDKFNVLQFEFVPSSEMRAAYEAGVANPPLSGRASFLASDDRVLTSAVFRDNKLVATGVGTASARQDASAEVDMDCFSNCLKCYWGTLPGWLQFVCGTSCVYCIAFAPACAPCIACVGGYASNCVYYCEHVVCYECFGGPC